MKKLLLTIGLLVLSACVNAQLLDNKESNSITQFTGGNYVFVEQGKLTFNLDASLFENRTWTFDTASDHAKTEFTANLPLKTKYASEFHGYEISRIETTEMRVVVLNNLGNAMLMRPVYRYGKQGRYIKTWLPAAAGWVMRVGGVIARNVLPPIIMKCFTNDVCKTIVGALTGWGTSMCIFFGKTFPGTICDTAEKEGFKRDPQTGEYRKTYPYKVTIGYGRLHTPEYREEQFGADTPEKARQIIKAKCDGLVGQNYLNQSGDTWDGLEGTIISSELHGSGYIFTCTSVANDGEDFPGLGFSAQIEESTYNETLTMVDITNFTVKDFKRNPNPYINDKGETGKALRDKIIPYAYTSKPNNGTGTMNISSNIYNHPRTGEPTQDIINIAAINNNKRPDLPFAGGTGSGGSSNGGSGSNGNGTGGGINHGSTNTTAAHPTSPISNTVTVRSIARPDMRGQARPAQNNSANGNNPSAANGHTPSGSNGGSNGQNGADGRDGKDGKDGKGFDCAENPNTLACAQMGDVHDDNSNPFGVPNVDAESIGKGYAPDNFMPATGICPAPKPVTMMGRQYLISYDWLCRFAEQIRMIVIGLAYLMAGYIIFAARKD